MKVNLTWLESAQAARVGVVRRITSKAEGMMDRAGRGGDWTADVEGAAGEMAFAKAMGIYWEPTNKTFSVPDVGVYEIKTNRFGRDLPVELGTPDDRIVVLVSGSIPNFEVVGWIRGRDAKTVPPTTRKYRPAHWVLEGQLIKNFKRDVK